MRNDNSVKLSSAMKKYLLGKELRERLQKAEEDYMHAVEVGDEDFLSKHKLNNKVEIAEGLGKECHLSKTTIISYVTFAEIIEQVKEKNEKLVQQVLSGETRMSCRDLRKMLDVL